MFFSTLSLHASSSPTPLRPKTAPTLPDSERLATASSENSAMHQLLRAISTGQLQVSL